MALRDVNETLANHSEALQQAGFECLRERRYEEAISIASELEELGHTAAFDIAAQAHTALADLPRAIQILERGVSIVPDCWLNWQLLGNLQSDLEEYEKALKSYSRALKCTKPSEAMIHLNQAVVYSRQGDHAQSLAIIDSIEDDVEYPSFSIEVTATKINLLRNAGMLDESLAMAETCLARDWEIEDLDKELARVAAEKARTMLALNYPKARVKEFLFNSANKYWSHNSILSAIIEVDAVSSTSAGYFRMALDVKLPDDHPWHEEVKGYFVNYDIVAETQVNALEYVREFEGSDVFIEVEKSEVVEKQCNRMMGVYYRSELFFYESDEEE